MNPLSPLEDIIPASYRKVIYAIASALLVIYAIWQASQGNIETFILTLLGGLTTTVATANTHGADTPVVDEYAAPAQGFIAPTMSLNSFQPEPDQSEAELAGAPVHEPSDEEDQAAQASIVYPSAISGPFSDAVGSDPATPLAGPQDPQDGSL